jgi:hypothetical protein
LTDPRRRQATSLFSRADQTSVIRPNPGAMPGRTSPHEPRHPHVRNSPGGPFPTNRPSILAGAGSIAARIRDSFGGTGPKKRKGGGLAGVAAGWAWRRVAEKLNACALREADEGASLPQSAAHGGAAAREANGENLAAADEQQENQKSDDRHWPPQCGTRINTFAALLYSIPATVSRAIRARLPRGSSAVSGRVALTASTTATAKLRCYVRARRTGRKGETAMVRRRGVLSAIFATLSVALAGCAAPLSRGYYAGGYPYGIHGYYCGEWSVWPGVSCVDVGPPERVYPPPADP